MNVENVFVFGNPDIATDALPLRILPRLSGHFPNIKFRVLDPNEEWDIPDPFIVIDTVVGLSDFRVFHSLEEFGAAPAVSVHDFDALFNLRYLAKLGKLKGLRVIGIPPDMPEEKAFSEAARVLTEFLHREGEGR
ncbi:MAG: hypothetical protein A3D65_05775 [Candidatus Lloydbacteria bacterium RIFCSPHIGHO2_02_FULL_50_13]|uniref:Hydrogenase maturation protease n=2 Tax=Bacteria candidate phyla TaxID=1783234 RepID=A0A1G2DAB4_9BACT|nr:MAG: hypothetical protein A3J33_03450 [candidate division WWE3 bacterium RIFCSPLOWO2_02_FULL_53_10]OGZ10567.1 MAG: hypothetical protein A3D65_05775 [Candidatus Lloydbacteria bacterium RIFCSPHIGHO2_02_FULL_50_13]